MKPYLAALRQSLSRHQWAVPVFLLALLAMVMLPLPPLALDIFFTFNIVLSLVVVLVAVGVKRPLDFAVFPTIILATTLLRLGLNVASTRVVLLHGQNGPDAAGHVIESFGNVVIGGNFVVGLVVFIILMIINFVVVTKGAERISEVSARFTLDALPGKQMAIDADLNAGLINQQQAQVRRKEVATEADFYGAMDGASKFVRGDAIASILILVINLIGGVAIGSLMHGLPLGESFRLYALLTIGDGLVAQIPALLLSAASAVIVTRISDADAGEFSEQVHQQLLAKPSVLYGAAAVMLVLGLIPGMPWLPFLAFAAVLVLGGWVMAKRPERAQPAAEDQRLLQNVTAAVQDFGWQSLPITEPLSVRVGYRLVSQLDPAQGAPLATRLKGVRQSLSESMGFVLPPVHVRDDMTLPPNQYTILIHDAVVAQAEVHADRLMAIPSPQVYGQLDGIPGIEPAYQLPVTWIEPKDKAHALGMGYQVADCVGIVATHVTRVVRQHLDELIRHEDVHAMHERLNALSPKLAAALEKSCPAPLQHAVFKQLLREGVSLKDIVLIATALVDSSEATKDPILLTAEVRCALRRQIVGATLGPAPEIKAFTLGNELEKLLLGALSTARHTNKKVPLDNYPVDPQLLGQLQEHMAHARDLMKQQATPPVLLVSPQLRPLLARYARLFAQGLQVLSFNEVPEGRELKVLGTMG
ncbi:flagellar biosynthesis protein FlhA [Comamonas guangdongensis]|uniref:Flagellar biosynthesis protein FlhA n=1 Tax=Comamonas guangdongensis TaxID=510515 RepID=A0ABV3ZRT0_9BURK